MKYALATALALVTSSALAQEPPKPDAATYLRNTLANCTGEAASLYEQANKFAREANDLRQKVAELEKKLGEQPKGEGK